jgi:hypothetical protein
MIEESNCRRILDGLSAVIDVRGEMQQRLTPRSRSNER